MPAGHRDRRAVPIREVREVPYDSAAEGRDPNHGLLIGNVVGALMLMGGTMNDMDVRTDVEVEIDAKGNYTGRTFVTRDSGKYLVTVVPVEWDED